jgi:hypothetical protein
MLAVFPMQEGEMAGSTEPFRAHPGDVIVVEERRVGEKARSGEILEVLGEPGHEHYRVRWEDEHESVFYPSSNATIRRGKARR